MYQRCHVLSARLDNRTEYSVMHLDWLAQQPKMKNDDQSLHNICLHLVNSAVTFYHLLFASCLKFVKTALKCRGSNILSWDCEEHKKYVMLATLHDILESRWYLVFFWTTSNSARRFCRLQLRHEEVKRKMIMRPVHVCINIFIRGHYR